MLRLPLFSLETRKLRSLDGIEVKAEITFDGVRQQFTYHAYRSTATFYPGPLSRMAHHAFLSIITESGFPFHNPVTWTWRDLCRRLGLSPSGRMIANLKNAIICTKGLLIKSEKAIYLKSERKPISTGQTAINLYDRVVFQNECMDGVESDRNEVWLSDWYLSNLNSFFTASIDYDLWKKLDRSHYMASRLYEFFLTKFYCGIDCLSINYKTLVQFIPATRYPNISKAKEQLNPLFEALQAARIINDVNWEKTPNDVALLQIFRGPLLPVGKAGYQLETISEQPEVDFSVRELRNVKPVEWDIVADFYREWSGDTLPHPSTKELTLARQLIAQHGEAKIKSIMPVAINLLRKHWADAKTFVALMRYIPEALGETAKVIKKKEHQEIKKVKDQEKKTTEEQERQQEKEFRDIWIPVWNAMSQDEKNSIRDKIKQKMPLISHNMAILDMMCLRDIAANTKPPITRQKLLF